MKICELGFDEYGELVGVSVNEVSKNYEEEKESFLNECESEEIEVEMINGGMYVGGNWGGFTVIMEVCKGNYVYVRMCEEGSVEESGVSEDKVDSVWSEYEKGVYICDDEEEMEDCRLLEEDGDFEGLRRRGYYMVDISEVENYNKRMC